MKADITVLRGERVGEIFRIHSNQLFVFGRDLNCEVQILDEGISRQHFIIEGKNNTFILTDQNSTNGTFVNGVKTHERILQTNDVIRAGDCHFSFKILEAETFRKFSSVQFEIEDKLTTAISKKFDIQALGQDIIDPKSPVAKYFNALKVLYQLSDVMHSEVELSKLFETIIDLTLKVVPADRAYLIMYNSPDESFEAVVVRRKDTDDPDAEMKLSKTVLNKCIHNDKAILSADASQDDRFQKGQSVMIQDIQSVICVPVSTQKKVLGAIYIDNVGSIGTKIFSEFELELVAAIGRQAGVAIQRAQLYENLEKLFYGTIRALVATIEAKDKYTHGHSERVTEFALLLAEDVGLDAKEMDTLKLSALLHDIGKIAVPERILNKPSRLSDAEFMLIKNHPVHGAEILRNITDINEVIEGVLHHHEKWNGTGYPDGLAGEDIPLHARILAVADAFDAMTSSRPYRKNFTIEEVIEELEKCCDEQFDSNLVGHFVKLINNSKINPHFIK